MKNAFIIITLSCFLLSLNISHADQTTGEVTDFVSNVIGVEEKMLSSDYWTNKIDKPNIKLLSIEQIQQDNARLFKSNHLMSQLSSFPDSLSTKEIASKILNISSVPKSKRYSASAKEITQDNYEAYLASLNISAIDKIQKVRFGIIVRRTNMRTFPTDDAIYKTADDTNLDRFQETALFPTETIAILHESLDKKWFFATSYNYTAWVKKADVAIADKADLLDYKAAESFIVITGSKVFTSYNPNNKNISEIQLEMGTVLPLVETNKIPYTIDGHNTYASHVISLPTRAENGELEIQAALIPRSEDVSKGFLPYTEANLVKQSFKFLGERYGWGHSFNARDCTGFIGEVYKSFGILMPRNSSEQGNSEQGENTLFLEGSSTNEKLAVLNKAKVGDLIYIPGHVMMVLGFENDQPFIIHDVSGLSYFDEQGNYYKSQLNGVSITPLLPLQLSQEKSYVDKIYNIKKIK